MRERKPPAPTHVMQPTEHRSAAYEQWIKPVIDRVAGAVLLLLCAPLLALIAAVVWASMGRPVLFTQQRVGRHGEPFTMFKFRTMLPDRRREQVPISFPDRRRTHKTTADPRHTAVGRVLRRLSLDELPQLLNVVQGEMSLVGPRPELPEVVGTYEPWQHARHAVKPGLTGLWQVSARAPDELMREFVSLDLEYVRHVSFKGDLRILLATIPAAVKGRGS